MLRHALALVPPLLFACSSGAPGFEPGERISWILRDGTLTYSECSDADSWRSQFEALRANAEGSVRAVQVRTTGTHAELLDCREAEDAAECGSFSPPVELTIEGAVMETADSADVVIPGSDCRLRFDEALRIEDLGVNLEETLTWTTRLEGDASECSEIEESFRAASENGLGVEGCRVALRHIAER